MDNDTRQWVIALLSIVLAPVLTFLAAIWRMKRLGLTKDNVLIVNERAEFRKEQIDRARKQDAKIERLDARIESYRLTNNRLYGHVKYLEAIMKARGIEFIPLPHDDMIHPPDRKEG